jgi:outer membrane lipoprotein SlyB
VLDQQPAAGQMRLATVDDAADVIQAIHAGGQRGGRFEAQVALSRCGSSLAMYGGLLAIRSKRAPAAAHTVVPALGEADVAQFMARSIARGHGQRTRAGIGGQHLRLRPFAGQRQCNRTAAGAQVGQLQRRSWRQALQRQLDQQLGFGRGISVAGSTSRSSVQNPRRPVR